MTRAFSALQELGDGTRLRVFVALLGMRKNVSQIVAELGLAQPQVSYHLRKLKDAGLAVEEKDGRWVWYQANWESDDPHLRDFIELMARWAEDAGALTAPAEPVAVAAPTGKRGRGGGMGAGAGGGGGRGGRGRKPVAGQRRIGGRDKRPTVERPKRSDEELDDFLL